jgi:hypothetical protein
LRRARLAGAWPLPGSTLRDEAPHAVLVQHEFWDGPNHIRIAHQREADVVQDQPLPVHARCYGRMIFLLKDVSQDDDPNIFMGQARLQQRNVLHDRIILAIAAMALQRLEGRAPMVRHAPLRLIAGGRDGQINCPVDQANTRPARAAGTFGSDIQQLLCDGGTGFLRTAARQHLLFMIDIGFDGLPFRRQSSGDRLGFHAE